MEDYVKDSIAADTGDPVLNIIIDITLHSILLSRKPPI